MYVYTDCFRLSVLSDSDCRHEGLGSGRELGAFRYFMSEVDGRSSLAFRVWKKQLKVNIWMLSTYRKESKNQDVFFWLHVFLVQLGNRSWENVTFLKAQGATFGPSESPDFPEVVSSDESTGKKLRLFLKWFHGFFLSPGRWPKSAWGMSEMVWFSVVFFRFFPKKDVHSQG